MKFNLPKNGNGLPFEILKWALLVYTGYRSLDILRSTMPDQSMLMALPALLGLDVGVLVWSYLYEHRAEGNQATLAALLTTADLIGVGMCLVADSLMHSALRVQYTDFINSVSIWLVAFVIFSNALGAVLYPMFSPHAERARKEKEIDAGFSMKKREAEHELSLAQLELQNARMRADARNLLMEATQAGAGNWPTRSTAQPALNMAKDAPTMPSLADEYTGKSADELREMLRSGKGQGNPKS